MHFCMGMQHFLPSRLLLERSSPVCWPGASSDVLGRGTEIISADCAPRTFLVYSWLEAEHVDKWDQGKLLCKARHSIAVQLHLSLLLTFGGRVVKSQLPPPQVAWKVSRVGLVSEVTGRCKLQNLAGAFGVLSPSLLLGETEKPLDLFYFCCWMHPYLARQWVCDCSGAGCLQLQHKLNPASKASKGLLSKDSVHTCTQARGVQELWFTIIPDICRKVKGTRGIQ